MFNIQSNGWSKIQLKEIIPKSIFSSSFYLCDENVELFNRKLPECIFINCGLNNKLNEIYSFDVKTYEITVYHKLKTGL